MTTPVNENSFNCVYLHQNLHQKQYVFALWIAPAMAVKLLDSIALSQTWMGHFLHANAGQYWMQINRQTQVWRIRPIHRPTVQGQSTR
jgi:hypothetical protein